MQLNAEGNEANRILKERREDIAGRVTSLYFEARPQWEERWKGARRKCTQDNGLHLDYLGEALSVGHPELFTEYTSWASTLLARLKIPGEELALNLTLLRSVLSSELEGKAETLASQH